MPDSKLRGIFRKYKIDNFPYPLYYCLPYALRFDLREHEGQELEQMQSIFESTFPKNHELILVLETAPEGKVKKSLEGIESTVLPIEKYDSETGELSVYERHIYALPAHKVPKTILFSAVLSDEYYAEKIYFADAENGVIMMPYDARGCDISAPMPQLLSGLYKEKKHLLSLIDLPQMKLNFED